MSMTGLRERCLERVAGRLRGRPVGAWFKSVLARRSATIESIDATIESLSTIPLMNYLQKSIPAADTSVFSSTGGCSVEINDTCNINCPMCQTSLAKRSKGLMDVHLFETIVRKLKASGLNIANVHTIGDPLANRRLAEYLDVLRKYGMFLNVLSSNCLLLTAQIDTLFQYRDVIHSLRPSIDAASKDSYERIRLGGDWNRLQANLVTFAEKNRRSSRPFPVYVNNVISKDNFHEIAFIPYMFSFLTTPARFSFAFINSLSPSNEYFTTQSYLEDYYCLNAPCSQLWGQAVILKDGRISTCCRDYHGDLVFGNIAEDDIAELSSKDFLRRLREASLAGDLQALPDCCASCYIVDPRLSILINQIIQYFYLRVRRHPVYLQNGLNRIGPNLKAQDFGQVRKIVHDL